MSVTELTTQFLQQFIPKINGKSTYAPIKELHKLLMENAAFVATMLGSRNHGHLALVMNPTRYLNLSGGVLFIPPRNLGPVPIPQTPFMMAAQIELLRQQQQAKLLVFHICNNTDTAFKNQLLVAADDMYLAAIMWQFIGTFVHYIWPNYEHYALKSGTTTAYLGRSTNFKSSLYPSTTTAYPGSSTFIKSN
eukprot:1763261-Ditylum_brightwellii.AAC.1